MVISISVLHPYRAFTQALFALSYRHTQWLWRNEIHHYKPCQVTWVFFPKHVQLTATAAEVWYSGRGLNGRFRRQSSERYSIATTGNGTMRVHSAKRVWSHIKYIPQRHRGEMINPSRVDDSFNWPSWLYSTAIIMRWVILPCTRISTVLAFRC
jgi:hypothetical protein